MAVDISWAIVYAVGPWQAGRHLMARDEHVVIRSAIYACLAVTFMQFLIYGAGGLINLADPGITPSETVIIWASMNLVPVLLGLFACWDCCSCTFFPHFLVSGGFCISNDIIMKQINIKLYEESNVFHWNSGAAIAYTSLRMYFG